MQKNDQQNITILGIGNAGVKIISSLANTPAAAFLKLAAIDTDQAAIDACPVANKILADSGWRHGAGCGGDVIKGQRSISRERQRIATVLENSSSVIVVGGLGGGTATGGIPIIASVAADRKIPAIFLCTMPFSFEGHSKLMLAEDGVRELLPAADALLCLPNDLLFSSLETDTPVEKAFAFADIEVARVITAISGIIAGNRLLGADLSSFRALLCGRKSTCAFGTGMASSSDGLNRCHLALELMLNSPFMGNPDQLRNAHAVLAVVSGGPDLQIGEMKKSLEVINSFVPSSAKVITATHVNPAYADTVQICAIAIHYDKVDTPPTSMADSRFQRNSVNVARERGNNHPAATSNDLFEQVELPLQNISKGIFANHTPNTYNGEDLDIPTFMRKMITIDKGQ